MPGLPARLLLGAVGVGIAAGVLTQVGQGVLPDGWRSLANSVTPWLAVAFGVGASTTTSRRWAAVAGAITLIGALVGYYGLVAVRFGYGPSLGGATLLWLIAAIVGGPVFGMVGHAWRTGGPWTRPVAAALLGASAIAEGIYLSTIAEVATAAPGAVVIGAAIPLVLGRSAGDRVRGVLALVPCVGLGLLGFAATIALYGLLTGI